MLRRWNCTGLVELFIIVVKEDTGLSKKLQRFKQLENSAS